MALDFGSLVDLEEKKDLLENAIRNLAFQGYQTSLRKRVAEALNQEDEVKDIDYMLSQIETTLAVHQEELNSLNGV
jgi:hypothetical protein